MSEAWDKILENFTDYRSQTNLWDEYSIADKKSLKDLKALFDTTFAKAKQDYKYLTELVMVLNHRMWYWYELNPDSAIVSAYTKYYEKAHNWALTHLNPEEIRYYCSVTD